MKEKKEPHIKKELKIFRILVTAGLTFVLPLIIWITVLQHFTPNSHPITRITSSSADSIVLHNDSLVAPIVYTTMPDFSPLTVKERKQRFIHMMLPSILLAQKKMATQRGELQQIINNSNGTLSDNDSLLLQSYLTRFKASDPQDLLKRMQPTPPSIILAQAAIESGWGTSRFFKEANNVYGMWSYNRGEPRIKAFATREGKNIYLRRYDSLFDSVYDYLFTIARSHAYNHFREARADSQNPYRLIWFLSNYSEQRVKYVVNLRRIIEFNNLTQYDHYRLLTIDKEDETWESLLAS